jgi:hypothetical protein
VITPTRNFVSTHACVRDGNNPIGRLFRERYRKSPERSLLAPRFLIGQTRVHIMRIRLVALVLAASCAVATAQSPTVPSGPDHPGSACPPGTGPNAPTVGKNQDRPLSDQLAQSKGVICPPAGVDSEMHVRPPEGGAMRVIPPPGSPGGNPNAQPK